ncbi:hypothetical protein PBI_SCTP2_152 [Salicola phage SCTP-2]|nr:hypothetical protein PBI_SCTP2_152 [Salicola phage SCTP-2]
MKFEIEKLKSSFPFLSHLETEDGRNYYGIILNCDRNSISFINIEKLYSQQELISLMKITQNWWWYSNRVIPMNIFYPKDVQPFMQYVTHLPYKTTYLKSGHIASLQKILDQSNNNRKNRTLKTR